MKRGELSMEVIIIAAIALLVLVILSVLIIRSGGGVTSGTSCTAPSIQGHCVSTEDSCNDGEFPSNNACGTGQKCCVPISKSSS